MFKIVNLSSQCSIKNLLKSKQHFLNKSSACFASAKPNQKLKNENLNYENFQNEPNKKKEEFIPDLFMTPLELANLSEEEKRNYQDFLQKYPIHKKTLVLLKFLFFELIKFIKVELFHYNLTRDDKLVDEGEIDMLFNFKSKNDIKGWLVASDLIMGKGYSVVNLGVNEQGRLLFSGYLNCDKLPDDGITEITGFAHLSSPLRKSAFGIEGYYNWSSFNHFVIRFRGDGRVYKICLKSCDFNGLQRDSYYEYFLYTRGGPYWQIAKIPFSKFILCYQSLIQEKPQPLIPSKIQSFAISLSKYTGPFKLEISHIGLQLDNRNYQPYDYEGYFRPEFS